LEIILSPGGSLNISKNLCGGASVDVSFGFGMGFGFSVTTSETILLNPPENATFPPPSLPSEDVFAPDITVTRSR
jgi:hypothetical protein